MADILSDEAEIELNQLRLVQKSKYPLAPSQKAIHELDTRKKQQPQHQRQIKHRLRMA